MTEDMYLNLAIELFKKGTWSKDVFIKKVTLYAKDKNMDIKEIEELISKVTNKIEYTIDDKRSILSNIKISGDELKYGDVVNLMSNDDIERFFELEKDSLNNFNVENETTVEEIVPEFTQEVELIEEVKVIDYNTELFGNKSINDIINGDYEPFDLLGNSDSEKEERFNSLIQNVKEEDLRSVASSLAQKMKPAYCFYFRYEWEKLNKNTTELLDTNEEKIDSKAEENLETEIIEEVKTINNNTKLFGNKSINDVIYGNYEPSDLLGDSDSEKEERFNLLIQNVKAEDLRSVANSLIKKMNPTYCLSFTLEWEKLHKEEANFVNSDEENQIIEEEVKDKTNVEENKENLAEEKEIFAKESTIVIPKISFEAYGEDDLPTTEEEYKEQAGKLSRTEKDSIVRKIEISPERLAKLKKTKNKAINCFLKTAMVILAFNFMNPILASGTVLGYMYFAEEIKCGTFNPTNFVGKAIKYTVEKVMNIGIKKDKENERGKAK